MARGADLRGRDDVRQAWRGLLEVPPEGEARLRQGRAALRQLGGPERPEAEQALRRGGVVRVRRRESVGGGVTLTPSPILHS